MYQGSDRMYNFAGEKVIPGLNQTAPNFASLRFPVKDPFNESISMTNFSRSIQVREPDSEYIFDSPPKKQVTMKQLPREPPRDLGETFVKILLDEFKRVRQISTKDPKVLLDFWKNNKKVRQKENENLDKSMRGSHKGDKSFVSQASQQSERIKELNSIAKEREEDVVYTLEVHAEVLKQEENMKKYILDAYRQRKREEEEEKNQKPKKMSQQTMDRLYKPPTPNRERPSTAQSTSAKTTAASMKVDYDKDFVQRLIELHAESRPTEKRHVGPELLFSFWQGMSNKPEYKMNKRENVVREDIQKYFDEKYETIEEIFETKFGYRTYEHKKIWAFFKNEISEGEKKKKHIDYDPVSLDKPLEKFCNRRKKEIEEAEKKAEEEAKKKVQEEKDKLSRSIIKKEIKATGLENLAKPKDKLVQGKTILFLKKMFPNDRILQRMLLNEFKKNKLLKYPEEYDVYDSDEEIEILKRDEMREPFKSAAKEGRLLQIKDFTKAITEREQAITKPFEKYLQQKYMATNLKIEDEKRQKAREEKEDKQVERFISQRVGRYLQLRKKRVQEKIPTLKEFLIQTYKEMRSSYREATDRRFPHITHGYSKRLKANSYPMEFKRYFFILVKAVSRGTKMSHGKTLLPFWAPPSAGNKVNVFLDTNKSYNKRVNDLSKETKIKRIEDDFNRTSCWQKEEFFLARLNIMMTFGDAKECTFTPNVGSKMPKKYQELMQHEYGAWANQYLTTDKASFDQWVNAMGTNLSKRFPTIYKYGKFKRALRYWKQEQYIKAYKEIAETFNIEHIKKHFNPAYDSYTFRSKMFSKENLKLEDNPKPQEDFGDAPNERFLQDVYLLIMFLESHEKDLQKSIKETEHKLTQDHIQNRKNKRRIDRRSKTFMCPLGHDCPEDIRPRWPSSSVKTISKFGQKCEFAHHTFELKFKQELNAKRKLLSNTLENLTKKLESDFQKPAFNPGGCVFTDCIGCGEELRTKGVSKGICASCQLRKGVNKKLQVYKQKAAKEYFKITQKNSFKENYEEKNETANRLNTKLGYYRKACVLYDNQRYSDAFTYIARAVEIVKNEKVTEEEQEQKRSDAVKLALGIDKDVTITMDMLYETEKDKEDGQKSNSDLSRAKLLAYAEKMGYIGEQKVDVNEFLNYEIQVLYLKIERALEGKIKDINLLQKKIEKLEGFDEEVEEKEAEEQAKDAKEMNETRSAISRKMKALRPKGKFDIDLVSTERKVQNLQNTIKYIRHEIQESTPPEPWRPTRMNNIILDIEKYDEIMSTKKLASTPAGEKPKELENTAKMSKDKEKSIYKRDLEELMKLPYERASPIKS